MAIASAPAPMKAEEAVRGRRRPALPGLAGSLMEGLANVVPFGTTLARPLAPTGRRGQWRPLWRVSRLPPNSPDPPDRRTSEEAHLRGDCGVRGDRNRRACGDGERGGCPERCDAAAGLGADADSPDDACDQVHLPAAQLEGGQVHARLPELR